MKNYKITIKGGGSLNEIAKALRVILGNIEHTIQYADEGHLSDGAEWEDPTLMTEISVDEEE